MKKQTDANHGKCLFLNSMQILNRMDDHWPPHATKWNILALFSGVGLVRKSSWECFIWFSPSGGCQFDGFPKEHRESIKHQKPSFWSGLCNPYKMFLFAVVFIHSSAFDKIMHKNCNCCVLGLRFLLHFHFTSSIFLCSFNVCWGATRWFAHWIYCFPIFSVHFYTQTQRYTCACNVYMSGNWRMVLFIQNAIQYNEQWAAMKRQTKEKKSSEKRQQQKKMMCISWPMRSAIYAHAQIV